jgi:hypothetical protein
MKQTAVEFLVEMFDLKTDFAIINQAKEMEKEQQGYSEEDMKQFALKCVITYTFNKNFISDNFRIPIERNNNNQFEQFKKK